MKSDAVVRGPAFPLKLKTKLLRPWSMGLSASDLIRLTFLRVAEEGRLPFDVQVPNRVSRKAMAELEAGKGQRFDDPGDLFDELDI